MWVIIRNQLIRAAFHLWTLSVRLRRRLRLIGRPRIGLLDHITIPVRDLKVAREFYCDVLGAGYAMTIDDETFKRFGRVPAPNGGEGSHHVSVYLGGATRVDLFLQSTGQPDPRNGHPHYAFRVTPGQLLKWKTHLESRGVPTEGPLQLGPPGHASLYFNDPFGNHLELQCMGFSKAVALRPPVMTALVWTREVPT